MSDEWLQKLKVGDEVYVSQKYSAAPIKETVSRITDTQIILSQKNFAGNLVEQKFRKKDGRLLGGGVWDIQFLLQPTPELEEQVKIKRLTDTASKLKDSLGIPHTLIGLEKFIQLLTEAKEIK